MLQLFCEVRQTGGHKTHAQVADNIATKLNSIFKTVIINWPLTQALSPIYIFFCKEHSQLSVMTITKHGKLF